MRGIQYAAASRFNHYVSGILDHPFRPMRERRVMTREYAVAISRRCFARAFPTSFAPLSKRGRRECRVRAAPAVSCAKNVHIGAHEHTGQRNTPTSPAQWSYGVLRALPGERIRLVTVACENLSQAWHQQRVSGPHDLAVRFGVSSGVLESTPDAKASITSPALRFVTIAKRPSCGPGWCRLILLICRNVKRNIFDLGA